MVLIKTSILFLSFLFGISAKSISLERNVAPILFPELHPGNLDYETTIIAQAEGSTVDSPSPSPNFKDVKEEGEEGDNIYPFPRKEVQIVAFTVSNNSPSTGVKNSDVTLRTVCEKFRYIRRLRRNVCVRIKHLRGSHNRAPITALS